MRIGILILFEKIKDLMFKINVVSAIKLAVISLAFGALTTFALQIASVNQGWEMPGQNNLGLLPSVKTVISLWLHRKILYISTFWLAGLFLLILSVVNRWYSAIFIYSGMAIAVTITVYQKMLLRNEAVLPSDVSELSSMDSLLHMIDTEMVYMIVAGFLVFSIAFIALVFGDWYLNHKNRLESNTEYEAAIVQKMFKKFVTPVMHGARQRVTLFLVVFGIISLPIVLPTKTLDNVYASADVQSQLIGSFADAAINGPLLVFLKNSNINTVVMERPAGYSKAAMDKIVNKYSGVASEVNANRKNESFEGQTVIYLLSESLVDPNRISQIKTNQAVMPNLSEITQNTTSGSMISSGFGGGTATVEYMTLTGMQLAGYNNKITTPYTQMISRASAAPSILSYFDTTASIHPYTGSFFNRKGAYKKLGLQQFFTTDSDTAGKLPFLDKLYKSEYVSDSAAFDNLTELVKEDDDKESQFLQLLTMQNHLPYPEKVYDFAEKDKITAEVPDETARETVETYLEGIHETDKELPGLLTELNETKRPITMVFYGDHWPGIFTFVDQQKYPVLSHTTDYFIWQNDAAKEKNGTGEVSRTYASPGDFSSLMLQMSNMKVTPYFALQTEVANKLPAVANYVRLNDGAMEFVGDDGKELSENDLTNEQQEILNDLKLVQYDLSQGEGHLSDTKFF